MPPKIVVLFTSYRCNSRCIMCSAWVKQRHQPELSCRQIEKIFADRLLRQNIEIVNLTGGEPTIRDDMVDIIKILVNSCHRLRRLDIPTNGIDTEQIIDRIERVLGVLLSQNVKLNVTVSVDGVDKVHEKVRGVNGIFPNIDKTIKELKELSRLYPFLSININTTISKANIDGLRQVHFYARSLGLDINFTLAAISEIGVESIYMRDRFEIPQEDKEDIIDFFQELINKKEIRQNYGKFIISWLRTTKRTLGCNFKNGNAFLLEPDGETYLCGNFREFRLGNVLGEPFENIWTKFPAIAKQLSDRCRSCASNCYIDYK